MKTKDLIILCEKVEIEPTHINIVCLKKMIDIAGDMDSTLIALELKDLLKTLEIEGDRIWNYTSGK
jgi:translation elongation factor EF-Tu-like GTPase